MKELSIIVVNYNTKDLLRGCLKSIVNNTHGIDYENIVIDNASSDGSVEMVRKEFPEINLICNKENMGYAKANNQGIKIAVGENILLLNSDTIIIENCLRKILEFSKAHFRAGVIGCRVLNRDKALQHSCYHFPNLVSEIIFFTKGIIKDMPDPITYYKYMMYWKHNKIREVDCIAGSFFWVKRKVFEKIGLLDEFFFMYYEDSEFCKRIRVKSDYKVYYCPIAEIIHLKGMSRSLDNYKELKSCYEGAIYYLHKCYGDKASNIFILFCKSLWRLEIALFKLLRFNKKFNRKRILLKKIYDLQ